MRTNRIRTALTVFLVSGACAQAQPLMQTSYSWKEVFAGTSTPVSSPNSILEPGEGALITLNLFASINGSDAIGQTMSAPAPFGVGIVRGIAVNTYDLTGTNADATGTWSNRVVSGVFNHFETGVIFAGGAQLRALGGVQFIIPGSSANPTNPITAAWRGVWNPTDFTTRVVHFAFSPSVAVPANQQNAFTTEVGIEPTTGGPLYYHVYVPTNFGAGVDIQVQGGQLHAGGGGGPVWFTSVCYTNCDHSTTPPILNANDFQCFLNSFAAAQAYANCDNSTAPPILNANDFQCFLNKFAAGCT